jgi:membrane-associated phospholipid phosphatase
MTDRRRGVSFVATACLTSLLVQAAPAAAKDPERVEWSADWPRYRVSEAIFTGLLLAQALTAVYLYPTPPVRLRGGILFDDAVRGALKPDSHDTREGLRPYSDNIYFGTALFPFIVDTALVAGAIHGAGDVALEMLAINAESYALSGALTLSAQKLGRQRPAGRECGQDPEYSPKCHSQKGLTESLFSGHTATAFTSAGVTCAHHQHLPLYGGGWPDGAICAISLALATTEGYLRVALDDHYASDVLIGAGVGLFSGYFLPSLLHYGFANDAKAQRERSFLPMWRTANGGALIVAPQVGASYGGVSLVGMY